eukprot:TRINITY_DN388_c0_g1_i7.p3 TRINITY_DN388_c0_g1~~TRINITY_DN388_c0_g1_i7.p3  ORF type:complete len:295 (+),score=47.37 TRINITY_DN388_c0_g1_i7:736-1620(+)
MAGKARVTKGKKGKKGKNTGTDGTASTSRSKNFTPGECVGVLTAAATHWAAHRGSRTGDKKRRSGAALLEAFVSATPAKDRPLALTRTADSINKKVKNMRSRYIDTCQGLKSTGMSTAQREDLLIKFGGAQLYDLAREAFKTSHVSTQLTVRAPVDLSAAVPTVAVEKGLTAVVPPRAGDGSEVHPGGSSDAGGDSAEDAEEGGGSGNDGGSVGSDGDVDAESGAESAPDRPPVMVVLSPLRALLILLRPHHRPRRPSGTLQWGSSASTSRRRCAPRLSARWAARRTAMCAKRW